MDPNLLYWKSQGQSFLSRFKIWLDVLDPSLLLSSNDEIQKAHTLLGSGEELNEKNEPAAILSLSSVHADSGTTLPLIFRPPAFLPMSAPLVIGSLLPHRSVIPALYWQLMVQMYTARFSQVNRNSSSEQEKETFQKPLLPTIGVVGFAACAGVIPHILIHRLGVSGAPIQAFLRFILPVPLSAALAFANVSVVRSNESETGIQVFDSNGNPIGFSKAAGEKAVRETALSRAALLGTAAAVPNLLTLLFQRRFLQKNSPLLSVLRYMSAAVALSLMIPVSFSLFPQLGTITKENVEEELKAAAEDGHLYYHRGL